MSLKSFCLIGRPRLAGELEGKGVGVELEGKGMATVDMVITDCDWQNGSGLASGMVFPQEPGPSSGMLGVIRLEDSSEVALLEAGAVLMTSILEEWGQGTPTMLVNLRRFGGLPRRATRGTCSRGRLPTFCKPGFEGDPNFSSSGEGGLIFLGLPLRAG